MDLVVHVSSQHWLSQCKHMQISSYWWNGHSTAMLFAQNQKDNWFANKFNAGRRRSHSFIDSFAERAELRIIANLIGSSYRFRHSHHKYSCMCTYAKTYAVCYILHILYIIHIAQRILSLFDAWSLKVYFFLFCSNTKFHPAFSILYMILENRYNAK